MAEPLYRDPSDFDEVQKGIINDGFREGKNCVVMGCAGSGKSCIAMAIFIDLCGRGDRKPVIITKQRSLVNTYLNELTSITGDAARQYIVAAHTHWHQRWFAYNCAVNTYERGIKTGWSVWKDETRKRHYVYADATDLLIDEAQDFTQTEMNDILSHFGNLKSVHFFGDDNQQIYEGFFGQTPQLSMNRLVEYAKQYGSKEVFEQKLYNNYRLPNPVAEFVDAVEGPETGLGEQCFGKRTDIPRLLRFPSDADVLSTIKKLVRLHKGQTSNYRAAVICFTCSECESSFQTLSEEHKEDTDIVIAQTRGALDRGNKNYQDPRGPKTIDGNEISSVNEVVTTAFSSKGLQYDDVFVLVDDFIKENGQWPIRVLNVLHVALTRTQGGLFVCYVNDAAYRPFADVPVNCYKTEL